MVLSEAEAEARLAALRRERAALDRAITDLTLYLELGRRLSGRTAEALAESLADSLAGGPGPAAHPPEPARAPPPADHGLEAGSTDPRRSSFRGAEGEPGTRDHARRDDRRAGPSRVAAPYAPSGPGSAALPRIDEGGGTIPAAGGAAERDAPPEEDAASGLSETVLARRHGRALIEAALAALSAAGRPLHAGEILAALERQGFALPGHDPVAALNTRLWKRAGPGGPLRRLGDAVYSLADTGFPKD